MKTLQLCMLVPHCSATDPIAAARIESQRNLASRWCAAPQRHSRCLWSCRHARGVIDSTRLTLSRLRGSLRLDASRSRERSILQDLIQLALMRHCCHVRPDELKFAPSKVVDCSEGGRDGHNPT